MKNSSSSKKSFAVIGLILVLTGIICNEWILAALFAPDGIIDSLSSKIVIWIFDVLSVLIGVLFIKYRSKLKVRDIVFSPLIFILFLFMMEGGLRAFYFAKNKIIPRERNFSAYLGWENAANISSRRRFKGYGEIQYSTTKWGFRVFGNIDSDKIKIFVIGNSITHGNVVSDGNTYYDYLTKNNNNIELFGYGGGGYGSLQEYMILDKYFDIIKPDIVLWQFSANDIINNNHELECSSFVNNNHMTRPYYKNGQIEYLYPKQNAGWINDITQSSYLLRLLNIRLNILRAEKFGTIEDGLSETHPLFKKSVTTTSEIIGLVRKRIGNNPIVAFSVNKPKWLGDTFSDICSKYAIHYVYGIPEAMKRAKESGIVIDGSPYDSHWNDVGHSITGKIILDYLIETKLLDTR